MSAFTWPAKFTTGSDRRILVEFIDLPRVATDGADHREAISVPLWLAPKLALYLAMRDQRVSNCELARRLGIHERAVRRMLYPSHASKPAGIQAALAALGKQVTVEVRDAA